MRSTLRSRSTATLVAAAFALAGCEPAASLPTTVDPVEMEADVASFEAGFESPATESFTAVGFAMDDAIFGSGGLLRMPAMMITEGPSAPALRFRERLRAVSNDEIASAIPLAALGKTFTYNITTDAYEISALTGAPANGVRFLLYALTLGGFVAEPLVQVGWVDVTRTSSGGALTGRIEIFGMAGTRVMDYSATVGGVPSAPTFLVIGYAGLGAQRVDFRLTTGFSALSGALSIIWQTDALSRNARSRVQLAIAGGDYPDITIGAMLRAGVRKVEVSGTLDNTLDVYTGDLDVEIGDRPFAIIHVGAVDDTVTDENGDPLTVEDEETMLRIYWFFSNALSVYYILLLPLYTVLDLTFL